MFPSLLILLLLQIPANMASTTSFCGKIKISCPFTLTYNSPEPCLKTYRDTYKLSCNNNILLATFSNATFLVREINYHKFIIRLVDPGINKSDCSSIPRYSISQFNFDNNNYIYTKNAVPVAFLSCHNPATPYSQLVNRSSCFVDDHALVSGRRLYQYVVWDIRMVRVDQIPSECRVDLTTYVYDQYYENAISISKVYEKLSYGFEMTFYIGFLHNEWIYDVSTCLFLAAMLFAARLIFCGSACGILMFMYKYPRRHSSLYYIIEDYLKNNNNMNPIRYSFSDVKKMTHNFREKLGQGGHGSVYKGRIRSGDLVAVKVLDKSKANGQDFINEVGTIGRIRHVNVVRLVGFCAQGEKRVLVYDFMPNGSLEKYKSLEDGTSPLSYKQIYKISLGVARGIEYLHRGCSMQILHFDIKPHNILLDKDFVPKVSDFGLAKLYPSEVNTVCLTGARGTMGYIAPEIFYKNIGGVSFKSDVYSFGMMLIEIASGRRYRKAFAQNTSEVFLPTWIYNQLNVEHDTEISQEDPTSEEEKKLWLKIVTVGLWCVQLMPSARPSMQQVLEMLERDIQLLEMPPKPFMSPHHLLPDEEHLIHIVTSIPPDLTCSFSGR